MRVAKTVLLNATLRMDKNQILIIYFLRLSIVWKASEKDLIDYLFLLH